MIREATINDYEAIEDMGKKFYAEADYEKVYGIKPDPKSLMRFVVSFISDKNKVILIDENKGMLMGAMIPWFLNDSKFIAQEMAWWVHPGQRGRKTGIMLFKAFEDWAKEKGAEVMIMGAISFLNGQKVGKFYERQEMQEIETLYSRKLKCQ